MKTRTKFILWTLPLWLIGFTFLYIFIVSTGLNVPWKLLGKPPENISRIVGYNSGKLFVSTDFEEMYSFQYPFYDNTIPTPIIWMRDQSYQKELDPFLENNTVSPTHLPPPPIKVKQLYQFEIPQIEGTNFNRFALTEDGNLWFWGITGSGLHGFYNFIILVGEILAYLFALFMYFVFFVIKRKNALLQ